jgi:hypothetical protein
MIAFVYAWSAVSVAYFYCTWFKYHEQLVQRQKLLRERVAYMLWMMANSIHECE